MSNLAASWRVLQGRGLYLYGQVLSATATFHIEGRENLQEAEESSRPLLIALWHGQLMPFVAFGKRALDPRQFVAVMVGDERGDALGAFARRLGGTTVRVDMDGNPFAAGRAVLRVIRAMQAGNKSIIAPDGPDGPAFVPKPGVAFLARKAGAVLLPVGAWTPHAIQLQRWDHYLLPFPFARCQIVFGEPLFVERADDQTLLLDKISEALHSARARAQVRAGVRPWR